jgi:hypothetical protein
MKQSDLGKSLDPTLECMYGTLCNVRTGQSKYRLGKEWEKNTKKTRENTRRIPSVQEGFVCYMYVHCMSYIWPSFLFSVAIRVTRSVAKFLVPELGGYSRLWHMVFVPVCLPM